jgi:methionyl-tRNA synthetase
MSEEKKPDQNLNPKPEEKPQSKIESKPFINYNDFLKMDIKIGLVVKAESIPKSRALLKLSVDLGEPSGPRQILAGMAKYYTPEQMVNKKVVVLANLEPRKMMGLDSNGMILAADLNDIPYLLTLADEVRNQVPQGTPIH